MPTRRAAWLLPVALMLVIAGPVWTQKPDQTASQFYMAYRAAFDKAASIEQLLPYMSKPTRAQVDATPAAERAKMFEVVKMLGTLTSVKVLKETKTADGVTLTVEGIDSDKKKTTGQVEVVRESGAWKLGGESWSSSS
jgi:hypothetical protein